MSLAAVADPDLRERLRCTRIIAGQTSMSALGAANWGELEQILDESEVGFIVYASSLPDAPNGAVELLHKRTRHLLLALDAGQTVVAPDAVTRTTRPVPEETLVLLARGVSRPSAPVRASFNPIDFIQMICMSGASQIVVLSQDGADTGVIEVREGEVWTAFDALGSGEAAFARLIRPEMRARIGPSTVSMKERTIGKGLHELTLESLRRIDEGEVSLPPPLSANQIAAATASPDKIAKHIGELTADARKLLMQRSYDEAARALISLAELDPASHLVRANLEQLRRLGYPK
jgi:hypothetical protein